MKNSIKLLSLIITVILCSCINTTDKTPTNDNIKIIPANDIQSLEDLTNYKPFKNKVIYFCHWEERSQPCMKELEHYQHLREKYKNKPVEFVFLHTVYGENVWRKVIYEHNLEGYHIQNNNFLIDVIKANLKSLSSFPMFMIFDKNGNLKVKQAAKPSDKEELYKQIDEFL